MCARFYRYKQQLLGCGRYFKLRDIGSAFDFGVDWDNANKTISIDTSKGYTPEN